jgi:hypothetical protein
MMMVVSGDDGDDDGVWIVRSRPIAEFRANSSPWTTITCSQLGCHERKPSTAAPRLIIAGLPAPRT